MPPFHVQLPDDLVPEAEARAAELGYAGVGAYVEALVRADAGGGDLGAADHLTVRDDAELEALLTRRLERTEPGIEATPAFWEKLNDEARRRREYGTSG
jgi:hypothetical protein